MTQMTADASSVASPPLLEVRDLCVGIPTVDGVLPAVTDVSFSIAAGEMVGVVGESGSGKSLTALALMGLLPAGVERTSGEVLVEGELRGGIGAKDQGKGRRAGMGMVFQNPMTSLNPAHRVGAQIAEAIRLQDSSVSRKSANAQAVELLRLVEINDPAGTARKYPHELSGGMRQRVVIAIALGCKPKILIADEPTTALDVTVQRSVLDLIDRIRVEFGLGVLFVSHDLPLISSRCERVLVMYAGEFVEAGRAHQVIVEPQHPYVDALMRCIPERALELGGVVQPLRGRVPRPGEHGAGCRFAPRCDFAVEQCQGSHPLLEASTRSSGSESAHNVRCWRADEISLSDVSSVSMEVTAP